MTRAATVADSLRAVVQLGDARFQLVAEEARLAAAEAGLARRLTGARVIGSRTTCLQAQAEELPVGRCTPVDGGEHLMLADGVTLRIVRWNHSGDSRTNPEQHDAVELGAVPKRGAEVGGILLGTTEQQGDHTVVKVEDFEIIDCDRASGPSFILSYEDRAGFEESMQRWRQHW